eukprot:scaffold6642_cov101-Isochrysis_galbana.AAC.2
MGDSIAWLGVVSSRVRSGLSAASGATSGNSSDSRWAARSGARSARSGTSLTTGASAGAEWAPSFAPASTAWHATNGRGCGDSALRGSTHPFGTEPRGRIGRPERGVAGLGCGCVVRLGGDVTRLCGRVADEQKNRLQVARPHGAVQRSAAPLVLQGGGRGTGASRVCACAVPFELSPRRAYDSPLPSYTRLSPRPLSPTARTFVNADAPSCSRPRITSTLPSSVAWCSGVGPRPPIRH